MTEDATPTPLSKTQASCLQLLRNARTDEEKFAGLLLIPRVFDSQNERQMVTLLTHLDVAFIQRLLYSTDHSDADSYREVGLAVLASFCVHWNLLNHPVLLSLLPHLIHTLKESVEKRNESLLKDTVPILVQVAAHPEGLKRLRDEGDTLVPTLITLIHSTSIDESLCGQAVRIIGQLLGYPPRYHPGDQQDTNSSTFALHCRVWATTFRGSAQLLYSEQRQLKFEILGAICDALSSIQTNEGAQNLADLYFTKSDKQSSLQPSHMGFQILHSLLLIKLTLLSILRQSHGSFEQKDVALLLIAQLVRLFGHAFFVPVGSSQFAPLRKELLARDHSTDTCINLGDVFTTVQETEEVRCFSLWLRMASIEFRMLLDERMLVPPDQSLAEIPAKRQEWMLPACLTILEAAIHYLAWVDDAPHNTDLTLEQSSSNLDLEKTHIALSLTYLEKVAHAYMTSLNKDEVLTWLNCLKESFSAAVVYLEELQTRGALTKALNETVTLAVVRGLCCWLAQDLTLLTDHPQLPHLLQAIIASETLREITGHFIRPVVQLWLDSIVLDSGPDSKIFTPSVCELVRHMGQTLTLLP